MGPLGPTSSPMLSYGRTQSWAPHDGLHHTGHWEIDVVSPPSHSPFTILAFLGSHKMWDLCLWAVPFPLHPSSLDVPWPLNRPFFTDGPPF